MADTPEHRQRNLEEAIRMQGEKWQLARELHEARRGES